MGSAPLLQCGGCCTRDTVLDSALDPRGVLCRRACGLEAEVVRCDPAGCVFDDTIRQLPELDRIAFRFAGSSNLAALRWLFVFGAGPKATDSSGTTLLHVACRTGSINIVKDLVRRGLDPNAVDTAGWAPLHVASCMGRQDVSLYLLQSGAKPHCKTARGQTPEDLCSHPCTKEVVVSYDVHARARQAQVGFPTRSLEADPAGAAFVDVSGAEVNCSHLHFEPFFVPRDPVLHEPRYREELQHIGVDLFNKSPGHGVAFLVAVGVVRDYPVEINNFLVRVGADPAGLGEFLGEDYPISQTLRLEFLNSLPLLGTGVVSALETAFHEMSMPTDWLKVDRLTRGIAHFWWRQHEEELAERRADGASACAGQELQSSGAHGELAGLELQRSLLGTDGLHRLMFSAVMLFKWLQAGNQMTLNEWAQLNTGIEGSGNDVPMHVQTGIFRALTEGSTALSHAWTAKSMTSPVTPTVEGWAFIHYTGRAQVSHDGDPAAWPDATPRMLAAQGGVSSAGRASPLPELDGIDTKVRQTTARKAFGGRDPEAVSVFAQPFDSDEPCRAEDEDAAWLALHKWILLLFSSTADPTPYAFVSLRHATLKEVDAAAKRLTLVSHSEASWPPAQSSDTEWLELFLLLGDGRFQPLEAPHLELRLSQTEDFDIWAARLRDVCCEDPLVWVQGAGSKTVDMRLPQLLSNNWTDEPSSLRVPSLTGEEQTSCQVAT